MKLRIAVAVAVVMLLLVAGAYAVLDYYDAVPAGLMRDISTESSRNASQEQTAANGATEQGSTLQHSTETTEAAGGTGTAAGSTSETAGEKAAEEKQPELRFMAVGDIMLGRGVGMRLQKAGSYEKAFELVTPLLKQGDVVFANLESPLTSSTHSLDSKRKIVLKGKPEAVSALTSAGFNLISLSNNHMLDYYEKGLFDTMSILEENAIAHAGGGRNISEAREPAIMEKNGLRIGLLAYTDMAELVFAGNPYLSFAAGEKKSGVVPRKYETVREDILKLRSQVDLIAVSLHWGIEDSFKVTPEQVEFAHKLIDDGADMILGHHPHQFQGMELYKGKPILYSMGNFLFDQNDPENMESFIIDMKYSGTALTSLTAIPVRILEKSYVEVQTGEKARNILDRQAELCRKLGADPVLENDIIVLNNE